MTVVVLGPIILALIHVFASRIRISDGLQPSWLSFAGGVAIAYVFIHILPVITHFANLASERSDRWTQGEWVFATALAGTCVYYAVEKLVGHGQNGDEDHFYGRAGDAAFLVHIGAFALYSFLIGYMIVDHPPRNALDAVAVQGALALHVFVVDRDLRTRHSAEYDGYGRWIMAGAVLAGGFAGLYQVIGEPIMTIGFAFLAGGMILNVFKEELPERSRGRLIPFAAGAGIFGLLFVLA